MNLARYERIYNPPAISLIEHHFIITGILLILVLLGVWRIKKTLFADVDWNASESVFIQLWRQNKQVKLSVVVLIIITFFCGSLLIGMIGNVKTMQVITENRESSYYVYERVEDCCFQEDIDPPSSSVVAGGVFTSEEKPARPSAPVEENVITNYIVEILRAVPKTSEESEVDTLGFKQQQQVLQALGLPSAYTFAGYHRHTKDELYYRTVQIDKDASTYVFEVAVLDRQLQTNRINYLYTVTWETDRAHVLSGGSYYPLQTSDVTDFALIYPTNIALKDSINYTNDLLWQLRQAVDPADLVSQTVCGDGYVVSAEARQDWMTDTADLGYGSYEVFGPTAWESWATYSGKIGNIPYIMGLHDQRLVACESWEGELGRGALDTTNCYVGDNLSVLGGFAFDYQMQMDCY